MTGSGRGRRYEPVFMRGLLDRAAAQGWSLVRLGRESGISLPTLVRWRRKLARETTAPRFVELVRAAADSPRPRALPPPSCSPPVASAPVELVFPGDVRLLVRDVGVSDEMLVRVLRAMVRSAC